MLLAVLGGSIGLHKFYLGQKGLGVMFILLTIFKISIWGFPLAALLGFLDAFRLLTMDERYFDRKYNSDRVRKTYGPPEPRGRFEREFKKRTANTRISSKKQRKKTSRKLRKPNPFKKSGLIKFKDYRYQEAAIDFEKALEIKPNDAVTLFNLACTYSLLEEKEKAFQKLSLAVENGMKDTDQIHFNEALSFIRVQREFDEFVKNGYRWVPKKERMSNEERRDKILEDLNKLKALRDSGKISDKEYLKEATRLNRT